GAEWNQAARGPRLAPKPFAAQLDVFCPIPSPTQALAWEGDLGATPMSRSPGRLITTVERMHVRGSMIVIVHADHDSVEGTERGHAEKLSRCLLGCVNRLSWVSGRT